MSDSQSESSCITRVSQLQRYIQQIHAGMDIITCIKQNTCKVCNVLSRLSHIPTAIISSDSEVVCLIGSHSQVVLCLIGHEHSFQIQTGSQKWVESQTTHTETQSQHWFTPLHTQHTLFYTHIRFRDTGREELGREQLTSCSRNDTCTYTQPAEVP